MKGRYGDKLTALHYFVRTRPWVAAWLLFFLWESVGLRVLCGVGFSAAGVADDAAFVFFGMALFAGLEALAPAPRGALMLAAGAAVATFTLSNLLFFRFFQTYLTGESIVMLEQVSAASSSIRALLGPRALVAGAMIPLTLLVGCVWATSLHGPRRGGRAALALAAAGGLLLAGQVVLADGDFRASQHNPAMRVARQGAGRLLDLLHLDSYAARARIRRQLGQTYNLPPEAEYEASSSSALPLLRVPRGGERWPARSEQLNVVLILMESVRALEASTSSGAPSVTPNLRSLAKGGITVSQFYAAGHQTVRSELALLCSVIPNIGGGQIYSLYPYLQASCLPELLGKRGYSTMWFNAADASFGNTEEFLTAHGVQQIHDRRRFAGRKMIKPRLGWGPSDEDLFDYLIETLDRARRPFFAEVLTLSNHHPWDHAYGIPRPTTVDTTGESRMYRDYLHGIHYTDHAVGRFFRKARSRPWFSRTIFVLTGDHGMRLRPRAFSGAGSLPVRDVDLTYRVPLIIYSPGNVAPRRLDMVASQIDVAPTVLELLGIRTANAFMGVSLLGPTPRSRRLAIMGDENGWSIRQGDRRCYRVGVRCRQRPPLRCPAGVDPLESVHTCFSTPADLLFPPPPGLRPGLLTGEAREDLLQHGRRLTEFNRFLVRTDSLYREAAIQ